jgi:hypothetical protein
MIGRLSGLRRFGCALTLCLTSAFSAGSAWAQATPEAAPPPPPAVPPPAAEPPPPPPAVIIVPPPTPVPPTQTDAMPATKPDTLPPISVGAWMRVGSLFQKSGDPSSLGDWHMSDAYGELHAGGKIHKKVGVTLNLAANMTSFNDVNAAMNPGSVVQVEDAIISFDFQDEFHLWAGHLLVPVDRANASGPFFMIPWYYPGFFAAGNMGPVGAPREGPLGRNNGAVVWGDINGGQVTYLAGVFDNANVDTSPLFSGRVRLALLDKEPGFWGNGSYFGDKDLFSIGIGSQYQKQIGKDYYEVNADVLFEKKLGAGSFFTAEGAYYHFNVDNGGVSDSMYALLAYATPTMGIGNIQPSVRFQWLKVKENPGDNPWNIDAGLAYLIKGPALRLMANYTHTDIGPTTINGVNLAAQAIFF